MITEMQKQVLLEMIERYAVDESLRGLFIGQGKLVSGKQQDRICDQRKKQIQTFLNNITQNQAEN